jgi:hypothetical protein
MNYKTVKEGANLLFFATPEQPKQAPAREGAKRRVFGRPFNPGVFVVGLSKI